MTASTRHSPRKHAVTAAEVEPVENVTAAVEAASTAETADQALQSPRAMGAAASAGARRRRPSAKAVEAAQLEDEEPTTAATTPANKRRKASSEATPTPKRVKKVVNIESESVPVPSPPRQSSRRASPSQSHTINNNNNETNNVANEEEITLEERDDDEDEEYTGAGTGRRKAANRTPRNAIRKPPAPARTSMAKDLAALLADDAATSGSPVTPNPARRSNTTPRPPRSTPRNSHKNALQAAEWGVSAAALSFQLSRPPQPPHADTSRPRAPLALSNRTDLTFKCPVFGCRVQCPCGPWYVSRHGDRFVHGAYAKVKQEQIEGVDDTNNTPLPVVFKCPYVKCEWIFKDVHSWQQHWQNDAFHSDAIQDTPLTLDEMNLLLHGTEALVHRARTSWSLVPFTFPVEDTWSLPEAVHQPALTHSIHASACYENIPLPLVEEIPDQGFLGPVDSVNGRLEVIKSLVEHSERNNDKEDGNRHFVIPNHPLEAQRQLLFLMARQLMSAVSRGIVSAVQGVDPSSASTYICPVPTCRQQFTTLPGYRSHLYTTVHDLGAAIQASLLVTDNNDQQYIQYVTQLLKVSCNPHPNPDFTPHRWILVGLAHDLQVWYMMHDYPIQFMLEPKTALTGAVAGGSNGLVIMQGAALHRRARRRDGAMANNASVSVPLNQNSVVGNPIPGGAPLNPIHSIQHSIQHPSQEFIPNASQRHIPPLPLFKFTFNLDAEQDSENTLLLDQEQMWNQWMENLMDHQLKWNEKWISLTCGESLSLNSNNSSNINNTNNYLCHVGGRILSLDFSSSNNAPLVAVLSHQEKVYSIQIWKKNHLTKVYFSMDPILKVKFIPTEENVILSCLMEHEWRMIPVGEESEWSLSLLPRGIGVRGDVKWTCFDVMVYNENLFIVLGNEQGSLFFYSIHASSTSIGLVAVVPVHFGKVQSVCFLFPLSESVEDDSLSNASHRDVQLPLVATCGDDGRVVLLDGRRPLQMKTLFKARHVWESIQFHASHSLLVLMDSVERECWSLALEVDENGNHSNIVSSLSVDSFACHLSPWTAVSHKGACHWFQWTDKSRKWVPTTESLQFEWTPAGHSLHSPQAPSHPSHHHQSSLHDVDDLNALLVAPVYDPMRPTLSLTLHSKVKSEKVKPDELASSVVAVDHEENITAIHAMAWSRDLNQPWLAVGSRCGYFYLVKCDS